MGSYEDMRDQRNAWEREAATLRTELSALREACLRLVDKMDVCKSSITGAFQMAYHSRGRDYDGPTYGIELEALRSRALSPAAIPEEGPETLLRDGERGRVPDPTIKRVPAEIPQCEILTTACFHGDHSLCDVYEDISGITSAGGGRVCECECHQLQGGANG